MPNDIQSDLEISRNEKNLIANLSKIFSFPLQKIPSDLRKEFSSQGMYASTFYATNQLIS